MLHAEGPERVYRDTIVTGMVCMRVSKSGTVPATVEPVTQKSRVNPHPCGKLEGVVPSSALRS